MQLANSLAQARRRARARRAAAERATAVAVFIALVAAGGVLFGGRTESAAVAAPGSHDGLAPMVLVREPASESMPAPAAPPARPVPLVEPSSEFVLGDYFVHIPPRIDGRLEVLVALHGMGGEGHAFCESLLGRTDRERWVVVAPTFGYGDWRDPAQITREESTRFIPRLHQFLEELPTRTGLDLEPRVALFGFSRGAQLAERFAMVYPEQTQGVAMMSAGTYTLPRNATEVDGRPVQLPYPFGTADLSDRFGRSFDSVTLQQVPFWVGVGGEDRNPADLPRQWDPYLGNTRVARAESFSAQLAALGVPVQLNIFPGVGHTVTDEIGARVMDFIATLP
jgi:poly(3-hydroxybutyrate) depolymerase